MSQNDFTIANQGFPAFRADLNSALQALASNNSGATEPSTMFANMWWYDSANDIMYIRNEDNDAWIKFAELDQANDKFVLSGTLQLDDGTVSAPALTFNSDTNMGIYRGGTDILKFVTAGTDAVTITASQQVGIGASSIGGVGTPKAFIKQSSTNYYEGLLVSANSNDNVTAVGHTGTEAVIGSTYGTSGSFTPLIFKTSNNDRLNIASNGDISFYEDTGTTPKFFWDASTERLGIGNSSPTNKLEISANATDLGMLIYNTSTGSASRITLTNSEGSGYIDQNNNLLRFNQSGGTDVAIDSSGNFLVGKTATNINNSGVELRNTGEIVAVRDNNVFDINRTSTDGSIMQFRKDGTTVGSIETSGGNLIVQGSPATGKTGIKFGGAEWIPQDTGANSDGGVDLGGSSYRFKDLYLSGGVYLGGTGSANFLDDYEEGALSLSVATGTASFAYARYTKVGNLVTIRFQMQTISDQSSSSNLLVTGLPFTSTADNQSVSGIVSRYFNGGGDAYVAYIPSSSSQVQFYKTVNNANFHQVRHVDLTNANANVYVTLSYETT